jgi:hypothetical protein
MYTRHMPGEDLYKEARLARERVAAAEADATRAKDEFRSAIRRLYLQGASLREIARTLGLSHQRVHQLLGVARVRSLARIHHPQRIADLSCSFCARGKLRANDVVAGTGVLICRRCIEEGLGLLEGRLPNASGLHTLADETKARCSFCGKTMRGSRLAADNDEHVCGECLALAREIVASG